MNIEKARELLEEVLQYRDNPQGYLTGTYASQIEKALRELQPEPRIIDWQRVVDQRLPVRVRRGNAVRRELVILSHYSPEMPAPFYAPVEWWRYATLETGQWVFNASGENPWPEGVLVEVWLRRDTGPDYRDKGEPAAAFLWGQDGTEFDIIASRAVGLEDGWTYGDEE